MCFFQISWSNSPHVLPFVQFLHQNIKQQIFNFLWLSKLYTTWILSKSAKIEIFLSHSNKEADKENEFPPSPSQIKKSSATLSLFHWTFSDHGLALSLTHSLTHSLPFVKLERLDHDGWKCQGKCYMLWILILILFFLLILAVKVGWVI